MGRAGRWRFGADRGPTRSSYPILFSRVSRRRRLSVVLWAGGVLGLFLWLRLVRRNGSSTYHYSLDDANRRAGTWAIYAPEMGAMYCPIPEVGCTEMRQFAKWLGGSEVWKELSHDPMEQSLPVLFFDYGKDEFFGGQSRASRGYDAQSLVHDPNIEALILIDDPRERLANSFVERCGGLAAGMDYSNCPYIELFPSLFHGSQNPLPNKRNLDIFLSELSMNRFTMFEEYVASLERWVSMNPCNQNEHWRPQYCFCRADTHYDDYTFVSLASVLRGDSEALIAATLPQGRKQAVTMFLSERFRSLRKKRLSPSQVSEYYRKPAIEQAVKRAYARDYVLFGDLLLGVTGAANEST